MFGEFFKHIPEAEHDTYQEMYRQDLARLAAMRAVQHELNDERTEDRMALLFLEQEVAGTLVVTPEASQRMSEPPQTEIY